MRPLTEAQTRDRWVLARRLVLAGASWEDLQNALGLRESATRAVLQGAVRHGHLNEADLPPSPTRTPATATKPRFTAPPGPRNWRDQAVCRDEDAALFHTAGSWDSPEGRKQAREAKAVCRRCPFSVVDACLNEALAAGDIWAIRGNTTPEERRRLQRSA